MRATVSMVPSFGFITALYAASLPAVSAMEKSSAVISSFPERARAKPLNICESITPEFPRAPFSAPSDAADATSLTESLLQFCISLAALCIVIDILVPVSPSGTGNTLSESIYALFFSSSAAPVRYISLSTAPQMVVFSNSVSSMLPC